MKGLLKFITCGSVDDGKSTLIGHILYDAKLLYADQEKTLELDSKVGSRSGAIDYSLLLDGLMAEREQGITIDVAYRYFTTDNRSFIVADTPGHEEYTRNMAVGASFADLSVILVDASQGVLVQTRRHARICKLMGIRYFVFAVNKMDLVGYSEERFREIEAQIAELRKELDLENVYIIPLSVTEGDNVTKKSENIPWYDGVPLLEYLENVDIHSDSHEKGFYMPVQRVCRPDHTFRGFQGQIEAGTIHVGDSITTLPSNETATVKGILMTDKSVDEAFEGQPVTISLDKEVDVSRGCVFVKDADVAVYKKLTVSLLWMDDEPLSIGKDYLVKLGTKLIPGILTKVEYAIDVNTGAHQETDTLEKNGIAVCEILLTEGIVADLFSNHKVLGELILIDRVTNMTSACGVVDAVSEKVSSTADRNSFQYGDLKARGDIFEEFYYDTESLNVLKYTPVSRTYTVGDEIPTSGDSYHYPDSFDCIVLRDGVAVRIRDKKITAILPASEYTYDGVPVTAHDLKAEGAMAALLKDAIKPNLVQTLEGTPCLMHGGPFANIAHGCNSVQATKLALKLGDIAITEAGFGADLGAEKFMDIKCRKAGLAPDCIVLVATVRALKYNGGVAKADLNQPNMDALKHGICNLDAHLDNMKKFGVPVVVAVNAFPTDTDEEMNFIREHCAERGVRVALSEVFAKGGEGGQALADEVLAVLDEGKADFHMLYEDSLPLEDKIRKIAKEIYGALGVTIAPAAKKELANITEMGYGNLPVCVAKTQYSLSDDASLLGRPTEFVVNVRTARLAAGAGFVVVETGSIMTMPGLPKVPAAEKIDVDSNGKITGLF